VLIWFWKGAGRRWPFASLKLCTEGFALGEQGACALSRAGAGEVWAAPAAELGRWKFKKTQKGLDKAAMGTCGKPATVSLIFKNNQVLGRILQLSQVFFKYLPNNFMCSLVLG